MCRNCTPVWRVSGRDRPCPAGSPPSPCTPLRCTSRAPATRAARTGGGGRRQPARQDLAAQAPLPLLAVTVAAVVVVTLVCAVVSYTHIRDLALHAGMGDLSIWLPLGTAPCFSYQE